MTSLQARYDSEARGARKAEWLERQFRDYMSEGGAWPKDGTYEAVSLAKPRGGIFAPSLIAGTPCEANGAGCTNQPGKTPAWIEVRGTAWRVCHVWWSVIGYESGLYEGAWQDALPADERATQLGQMAARHTDDDGLDG